MPLLLGVDLGTTKITTVAFDSATGQVCVRSALSNDANITPIDDRLRGRSEWDANRIIERGLQSLAEVAQSLGSRCKEVVAIGITGQQHGTVLVDSELQPLTPLINWQDRRGLEAATGALGNRTWLDEARMQLGDDAIDRCGCRLQPGFLALTLHWLRRNGLLPPRGKACFIMDLFAAKLSRGPLGCEPSAAGSSGVFSPRIRNWDLQSLTALDVSPDWFPPVIEATTTLGPIDPEFARRWGFRQEIPIYPAIGDHQASFIGSIGDLAGDVLVNVGTGAQVAMFTERTSFAPPVELRPFPITGNLLSNVGLPGGWSYQILEQFFAQCITALTGNQPTAPLYDRMNELASHAGDHMQGLRCLPTFAGTRSNPAQRGELTGMSPGNLSPGTVARAVLEGMATGIADGLSVVRHQDPTIQPCRLVAAGNGLRENRLLAELVQEKCQLPLVQTDRVEEAAAGAAMIAAVASNVYPDLAAARMAMCRLKAVHN